MCNEKVWRVLAYYCFTEIKLMTNLELKCKILNKPDLLKFSSDLYL